MSRRSRILAALVALVALAGCLAVFALGGSRRDARLLAEAVAKLDAEEPGWRFADLAAEFNAELPPPGSNAADAVAMAVPLAPPSLPAYLTARNSEAVIDVRTLSNRTPAPDEVAALVAVHADCAAMLRALGPLLTLEAGGTPLVLGAGNPLLTGVPHLDRARQAEPALQLDIQARTLAGDGAGAVDGCVRLVILASGGVGAEPFSIAQWNRAALTHSALTAAEQTLAWCELSDADLVRLRDRLRRERNVRRLELGLRGQRALVALTLDGVAAGTVPAGALAPFGGTPGGLRGAAEELYYRSLRGRVPAVQLLVLGHFAERLAAARLPDPERSAAFRRLASPPGSPGRVATLAARFTEFPPDRFALTELMLIARLDCGEVAVACERFRLRSGRYPTGLADLPPDLLAALPVDPCTGKPLTYRLRPEGAVVYSAGPDGIDDGGAALRDTARRGDPAGGDVGFRLWNPDLRRASP